MTCQPLPETRRSCDISFEFYLEAFHSHFLPIVTLGVHTRGGEAVLADMTVTRV